MITLDRTPPPIPEQSGVYITNAVEHFRYKLRGKKVFVDDLKQVARWPSAR